MEFLNNLWNNNPNKVIGIDLAMLVLLGIYINKDRRRIKVFEPFEDISKLSPSIDAMQISFGCVYKRSSKPVMKGSRVETIEQARKEYKELLEEGWKKTSIFNSYFWPPKYSLCSSFNWWKVFVLSPLSKNSFALSKPKKCFKYTYRI